MRFKNLEINGFKSFSDKTTLLIEDGLTGIVGPNGCGKSNIVEALRWCMGENSAKSMRGSGMEDVIFSGTSNRPSKNISEVALLLDNKTKEGPSQYNEFDEITIRRKIEKDRGSKYYINDKEMRARDVQTFFADLSTGAHSPSLISQGRIGQLVTSKPIDRRSILEEAAGISGLYQRRHEAELKLRGSENNLSRVNDVVEQLDSQLGSLARQARQAKRYREIGNELRQSEGLLLYRRWREADIARQKASEELAEATKFAANDHTEALQLLKNRQLYETKVPPLREEEAIASAVAQRLNVQRDTSVSYTHLTLPTKRIV